MWLWLHLRFTCDLYVTFRALEYYLKVSNYAALNAQDAFGGTFLFWAAVAGQLDTVEMLLKVGANPRISAFSM